MTTESFYSQDYEFTKTRGSLKPLPLPHLTGMKLARDISINGFLLNTIDEFGVVWVVTDIEGWWSVPEPEVPDIPRGYGDGSYDVKGRYKARSLVLNGSILTSDPSLVEAARDRLTESINLVYKGGWLKTGSNPIRASWVRVTGPVTMSTVNARGRTDFSIGLRAVDPIKYEWNDADPEGYFIEEFSAKNINISGSGEKIITNIGNYPVPVIFEVFGPLKGPAKIFNRTSNELILITDTLLGTKQTFLEARQMKFDEASLVDIATIYSSNIHNFSIGDSVSVSGVPESQFNGVFTIQSIPTPLSFTYSPLTPVSIVSQVVFKQLLNSVATIETLSTHGLSVGDTVFITDVDPIFNGNYTVTGVPSTNKFTYAKTRVPAATISGSKIVANVATITTTAPHNFVVGETVTIAGVNDVNYNGSYTITSISNDGLQFSYAKLRNIQRAISATSMTNLVATITTAASHGFVVGESISISGASGTYNGSYLVNSVPSSSTFTFLKVRSNRVPIIVKSGAGGTATLTTSTPHGLAVNETVVVSGVGIPFDGSFVITEVPSSTTFSYGIVPSTIIPTTVSNCFANGSRLMITSNSLIGSVATLATRTSHGFNVGETVTVSGLKSTFNGTYVITAVTDNTFSYTKSSGTNIPAVETYFSVSQRSIDANVATLSLSNPHGFAVGDVINTYKVDGITNGAKTITAVPSNTQIRFSQTAANLSGGSAGDGAIIYTGFASVNGSVSQETPTGATATSGGDLAFAVTPGTASVSTTISRVEAVGVAVKKNETIFTPGLSANESKATAKVDADVLEIDTYNREVAFNGETVGARGKIDVLADFITLQPGENVIEFEDSGSSVSESAIRVFYRSGWLT